MNHTITYTDFDRKFCYVFDVLENTDSNLENSFIIPDEQYLQQIIKIITLWFPKYNISESVDRITFSERINTLLKLLQEKHELLILKQIISSELYLSFCNHGKILAMH